MCTWGTVPGRPEGGVLLGTGHGDVPHSGPGGVERRVDRVDAGVVGGDRVSEGQLTGCGLGLSPVSHWKTLVFGKLLVQLHSGDRVECEERQQQPYLWESSEMLLNLWGWRCLHMWGNHQNWDLSLTRARSPSSSPGSPCRPAAQHQRRASAQDLVCRRHCEICGSYLQQPHQHHVSRAHFEAAPHSQAEANT